MRRVLREFFRLQQAEIRPADLVIRVQKAFDKLKFYQIKQEFDELIIKLNKRSKLATEIQSAVSTPKVFIPKDQ